MPADRDREELEFSAPPGGRVKFVTRLCFALGAGILAFDIAFAWFMGPAHPVFFPLLISAPLALVVLGTIARYCRIHGYRLTADELLIVRRRSTGRHALRGLQSATPEPRALQDARRTLAGNDGLGAMNGRFRSGPLGEFEVQVSDPGRCVVLRWPERTLVVSPDRPEEFAERVRRRVRQRG
jgi:hypothetical protein